MSTPEQLGKYKIVRTLGKGAMGIVYEGFDPVIERTVAIKTIRMDELDESEAEEHSRRFRVEAKAAGKLNHPNIVGIYDYGEEQNLAYIVMEYVQGKELKSYLDSGQRFPVKQIVNIMTQLLEALGYSHARGVIHRDIKPANLFITEDGTVKLGDFGIARIDSTHKTHAGTVLGTPSYMSPEQIKGESVDNRSDLYSSGVILYQFLTGEKPFSGSMVAVMHKVLTEAPARPSSINPQVTAKMEQVVAKAMAKEPDDRYANAREFIEALRAAVGPEPAEDDAEATRIIDMTEFRAAAAAAAADKTGRTAAADATGQTAGTANLAESEIEIEFWRSIKDSNDADDFDIYLKKYPQGHYAELAQLKLNKLRRAEATISPSAKGVDETASGRTGSNRIEDIRRKAEEARRKAEDEMRRVEEELQRAEAAQFKAEEEAREKAAKLSSDMADLQESARVFAAKVAEVLATDKIKEARNEIRDQAAGLLQETDTAQTRLQELLKSPDLLGQDAVDQAGKDRGRCDAAANATREALQQYEAALRKRLDILEHSVDIITRHGHEASQALQETERLAEAARQAGVTAQAVAEVKEAAARLHGIAGDARKHIELVLQDQELLLPDVLKTVQTAESAYGRAEAKAQETVVQIETALRKAEEAEAKRKAEEAEAKRKAEEAEAKRKAEEAEAKRKAEEAEAKRKAEEAEAKRKAEEAEAKRKAEEAEAKRKAEEAEAKRKADEAEAKRKAEEAEAKRKADEAEAKRKADETEAKRKADEAEAKRKAEETEAKRKAEEAEAKRKAEEAEAKRKADEAEAKRKADEAEAKRKAEETEAKRKAEEAEAKRKADETEAKRKAEEAEAKRKADEAEAKRKADEAEAKRKADEAESKRKADEAEAKRKAEAAAADETLVAPAGTLPEGLDSDATIMVAAPTPKPEPAPAPRPAERPIPTPAPEKKGLPVVPIAIGGVVVAGIVGWLMMKGPAEPESQPTIPPIAQPAQPSAPPPAAPSAETQAATQQAEAAKQATAAARQQAEEQQRKLAEAQKAADAAKRMAEDAKRMGDAKQAEEARRKAEVEMRKAEEARAKAAEEARRAEDEAKRRAAEESRLKAEAETRRKAEADAQRKAAEEERRRAAAEAETQRKAAEAEAQRKAAAEAEAQRKAAEAEAQRKAAAEAKPATGGNPADLFQQAKAAEADGRFAEAVRTYKQAANSGYGPASKRLGEIYLKGAKGVSRDYAESVRWYDKARQQGMDIPN